jgi:hypothetical protein
MEHAVGKNAGAPIDPHCRFRNSTDSPRNEKKAKKSGQRWASRLKRGRRVVIFGVELSYENPTKKLL